MQLASAGFLHEIMAHQPFLAAAVTEKLGAGHEEHPSVDPPLG
jgi:hypothetical protein